MAYTIIGHYKNTGERLFENIYVRTSCVLLDDFHVNVGYSDSYGLRVCYWWVDGRYSNLGLSSARSPR